MPPIGPAKTRFRDWEVSRFTGQNEGFATIRIIRGARRGQSDPVEMTMSAKSRQACSAVDRSYDSRFATSVVYFSYSAREIRPPSRSTRARSFAGKEACTSSTRFQGAKGVTPVERGTNSDG